MNALNPSNRCGRTILAWSLLLSLAATVHAVKPKQWQHQSEADFSAAHAEQIVVSNLGDVQLARATSTLADLSGEDAIVYDLQQLADGRSFIAVGPRGKLAQVLGGKLMDIATWPNEQVFALSESPQGLWVAISGTPSRLELRSGPEMKVARTIELADTRYVWDLLAQGTMLFAATGTEGRVLAVDTSKAEAPVSVILDSPHTNVLCLGIDGSGRVYTGSDDEGIVYRLTRREDGSYESFALYDAAEPEIGALLVLADGTVYAGTADASQARPGRLEQARGESFGRGESDNKPALEQIPNLPPKPAPKEPRAEGPTSAANTAEGDSPTAAPPTAEQYDQLRNELRQRLTKAASTGRIEFQARTAPPPGRPSITPTPSTRPTPTSQPTATEGNAIYRINPDGFVREIFRETVMILRLAPSDIGIFAATGNEGQLFFIEPETGEVTRLVRMNAKQIPALWRDPTGGLVIGTANPGRLAYLNGPFSNAGTLRSQPLDAEQVSLWGKLTLDAITPANTSVLVQTRSGNVGDPEDGPWWSDWSEPQEVHLDGSSSAYLDVASPPARFLQYRLTLKSDGQRSPSVQRVSLKYLTPNMQPTIAKITTNYAAADGKSESPGDDDPKPRQTLTVQWEATDPNGDALLYTLTVQPVAPADAPMVVIGKDLKEPTFQWDTQTIPDGRYVLRVGASDSPDNVAGQALMAVRRSDPITVDNTPPTITDLRIQTGNRSAVLSMQVNDALSPIAEVRYQISGSETWHLLLPEDFIYDSTQEQFSATLTDLAPGAVSISVRVTDELGNTQRASRTVKIE